MDKIKRIEISVAVSLVFCLLLGILPFERRCDDIRGKVLRLHILANSDSPEDQALKLCVRDRLLELSVAVFKGCESIGDALAAAEDNLSELERAAQCYVYSQGYPYRVKIELEESFFLTREYDGVTLPAGIYGAMNVYIGNGAGHNWWCVMFPMLCVPGSDTSSLEEILSEDELEIVEGGGFEVKFKLVEIIEKIKEYLRENELSTTDSR